MRERSRPLPSAAFFVSSRPSHIQEHKPKCIFQRESASPNRHPKSTIYRRSDVSLSSTPPTSEDISLRNGPSQARKDNVTSDQAVDLGNADGRREYFGNEHKARLIRHPGGWERRLIRPRSAVARVETNPQHGTHVRQADTMRTTTTPVYPLISTVEFMLHTLGVCQPQHT